MNKNKILYIIFYSCFILYWYIGLVFANISYDFRLMNYLLASIGGLSFIFMWINSKFSRKEIIYQVFLLLFLTVYFIMSGKENYGILTFFLAIVGLKNIKIKSAVKVMFYTLMISFLVTILFCFLGLFPIGTHIKIDAFGNNYSMIMIANQHGNTIFVVLYNILASFLYSYFDRLKKHWFIYLFIFVVIFYMLFSSRTGLILSLLTLFGVYYYKFISNKDNRSKTLMFFERNIYTLFYAIIFIIGFYMANTSIFNLLNKIVSSRIFEVNYYLKNYGIGLFPKNINYDLICDNTQVKVMVSYGLLFMILYFILTYKTIKKLQNDNKKIEIFFMIVYLLYSYSEVTFFKPLSDFTILFLAYGVSHIQILDFKGDLNEEQNKE